MKSNGFSRWKGCAMLGVIAVTMAAVQPAPAATQPHIALAGKEPFHRIRDALDDTAVIVRLNADGSLTLSQRGDEAGAVTTVPSIKALPAAIDALVPGTRASKKLDIAAEPTVRYGSFMNLMFVGKHAGFGELGVLELDKKAHSGVSEIDVHIRNEAPNLNDKSLQQALFVSLGDDGDVILSLGIGDNARGTVVKLAKVSDGVTGLVPAARTKKKTFFRADSVVPTGSALGLLHKFSAMGFKDINMVGEEEPGEN